MFAGLLVYLACGCSGLILSQRLALNGLLKRIVFIFAVGSMQLLSTVQLLSIFCCLNGPYLFGTTLVVTLVVVGLFRHRPANSNRVTWRELLDNSWSSMRASDGLVTAGLFLIISLGYFLVACGIGGALIPHGDLYHYEMPLFWKQNASILPFPAHNPRITATAFLAEGLLLPGYLYARSPIMHVLFTGLGCCCAWAQFTHWQEGLERVSLHRLAPRHCWRVIRFSAFNRSPCLRNN